MSDRTTHDEDDLFDKDVKDDTKVDDDDATETDTDEQKKEDSDSKDEQKPDLEKKTEAEKQAEVWEVKTKEGAELPKNLQWLKKDFPDKFGHLTEEEKKVSKKELRATIREEVKAENDENEFKARKKDLNAMDLDDAQREVVDEEYADLRADGVPQNKALKKAMKFAGIKSLDEVSEDRISAAHELAPQGYYKKQESPKTEASALEERMSEGLPKGYNI